VSFPTQTLGKCGKMIPVLIIGSALYRKTYGLKDYLVALTVMGGSALFLMSGVMWACLPCALTAKLKRKKNTGNRE